MEIYIKGGLEDKIAFLIMLLVFIAVCIICKIKWWLEDRGEKNKIMNEKQKSKRKFRQSKKWKEYKKKMREDCGKKDAITHKPLRGLWQLHHRNLDERQYEELRDDWFLPCNNLTHKMIHWMYTYYKTDPQIIDRLRAEMEKMAEINKGEV